ncbi:MAG: transposase, partial [Nitrospirota bacterium]|nr:transposase [Nitrospirota bacterium]
MIYTKDHKTRDMFDQFPFPGPKRKQRIEASWAKIFREHILPTLPVEKVFSRYNPIMGAPTKELYAMLGLMVIQQMHDMTDEEAVDQFAYNLQRHYAMNITSTADADAYVSPKTLWTMRNALTERNLYQDIFNDVTTKLAEVFSVDVSKQRFDSVHIFSNMRHLGRIGLFVKTIKKFLVNLKRHHKDLYEALYKVLADRYTTKQGEAVFSMVKPSESMQTLASLAEDVFTLVERFRGNESVVTMTSYQFLVRLLREQCILQRVDTHTTRVAVKANKDVASDSLQNPSDPEAGYDGYKGQGYQVQVAESYGTSEDTNTLNLITGVIVESAHKRDAHALIPLIETTEKLGLKPKEALIDTLYGGVENCRKAE